jgi:hypothetical protein
MPWKVKCLMDKRLRFIARLLEGQAMTDLCVEFGISRKTDTGAHQNRKSSVSFGVSFLFWIIFMSTVSAVTNAVLTSNQQSCSLVATQQNSKWFGSLENIRL